MILSLIKPFINSYSGFSLKTWINIFAVFINSMGSVINIFLPLYLVSNYHLSMISIGYTLAVYSVGMVSGSYIGGHLSDRFHAIHVSINMLWMSGVLIVCIPLIATYPFLLVLLFCIGLCMGAFKPANLLTLTTGVTQDSKARVQGLYRLAMNLGLSFAAWVGGVIVVAFGYNYIFLLDGITSILAGLILWRYANLFKNEIKNQSKEKKYATLPKPNMKFLILCCVMFLVCLIFFQVRSTYPIYLKQYYQLPANSISTLFLLNCLIVAFIEVPLLTAVRHINNTILATVGAILTLFAFVILPFGDIYFFAIISCVLWSFGEIVFISPMYALALDDKHGGVTGKQVGFFQTSFLAAMLVAPLIGTFVYGMVGGNGLWYLCGGIGLLSVFGLIYLWIKFSYE